VTRQLAFVLLLAACIGRLWLMPLGSSFWVDEAETAFVVHFGYHHPSLAIVPQVTASVYYWLPRAAEALFGFHEAVYRLPSLLAMGIALFFVARLAARLIHPEAAWFAVFACLAVRGVNYEAANARPYALGICVASATLWALVRWLDSARWLDALVFVAAGALLWRVQLIYWPIYFIPAIYVPMRIVRAETKVSWTQALVVAAVLAAALAPLAPTALEVNRDASTHAFASMPSVRDLFSSFKFLLPAVCTGAGLLLGRVLRWPGAEVRPSPSAIALIAGWWAVQPLALFAFSLISGNSVFSPRYLSIGWPGTALTATLAASYFIPPKQWKPLALALSLGVLVFLGQWRELWPPHHNSDWRGAAQATNALGLAPETPVIFPSPFVEAQPPRWSPDYRLPGFLYCHLTVYPVIGRALLFPYEDSPEAQSYAKLLASEVLPKGRRFVIYGDNRNVHFWRDWFATRPELEGWRSRLLGPFGDVDVAVFESP
jgi:4-amino-4-deoxy-L-arabinose transferase-like glycosyltransferase